MCSRIYVGLKLINKPGQYHYFKMGKGHQPGGWAVLSF